MEYSKFIRKNEAYQGFKQLRNLLNDMLEEPNSYDKTFEDVFNEVGALAMGGNPIAQDVMSYYYKDGVSGFFPENYDLYMKWAILSAANGNEFAIEKLQFFLNFAFSEIITGEKLTTIIEKNDLNEKNYLFIIGNLLCEGIVDEMKITAKGLATQTVNEVKYTPERLRRYKSELEKAVPKVVDFLIS